MKRILITGSLGLVGSACMETFAAKGWEVVGLDNNSRTKFFGTPEKVGGLNHSISVTEKWPIFDLFSENKFDAIIHCAGQPSHDWATDHALEDFDVNSRGTLILLEATRKYSPQATFVYVSSDKVYGENMIVPNLYELSTRYDVDKFEPPGKGFDENLGLDFAGDRSLFGCSKAAADMYVQCYAAKFGMKTACFRPGCITGKNHAGAPQHGFLAYLAKCIKEGLPYTIHGNGKQVRDQIHASDLATAFFEFVAAPQSGAVYNIGGGPERSISVLEAIQKIEKITEKKALLDYGPEREGDRRWDVHDVSKFRKDFPTWDYHYSLHEILLDLAWDGMI